MVKSDKYFFELSRFKRDEKPETVLTIANERELTKIVVAWTNTETKPADKLTDLDPDQAEHIVWQWLWDNTVFSLAELKTKAGVPYSESVLQNRMNLLIGNRVLYPDGTLNSFVQRYLRESVVRLFETKSKKSARK